jgi:hypothetical protein
VTKLRQILSRHRVTALALIVSAVVHAGVMLSVPQRIVANDEDPGPAYSATLEPGAGDLVADKPAGPSPPRPPRPKSAHPRSRIAPPAPAPLAMPEPLAPVEPVAMAPLAPEFTPAIAPAPPEKLALAQPAVPVKALEPEKFPTEEFPASLTIDYKLTSAFADGKATYRWERDGDTYRISAEAAAEGFFTLFLEGRIIQESRGTVTATGLRPSQFSEHKPGGPPEGLEFDWAANRITFDRNGEKKTAALVENTVDWLSMIFQLAHVPPAGETFDLRVYTQRRLYNFKLKVLGIEEIEIPIGKVRALHLHHVDPENEKEVVDVWLGVEQHYLPVKLRYPVARNRFMVEQVATEITQRGAAK